MYFTNTDKNLVPYTIKIAQYLNNTHLHLNNREIYDIISKAEAISAIKNLESKNDEWINIARRRK